MRTRLQTAWPLVAAAGVALALVASGLADAQRADDPWRNAVIAPNALSPVPANTARPADHDAAFLTTHGARLAAGDLADCASCHTEQSCADCHEGLVAPVSVHPVGWRIVHGFEATNDVASCATCHTATRFCASCHVESDIVSAPDRTPPPTLAAHPPTWMDPGAATNHADEARANLMSCASCHTGAQCATCHATINPHGPGFSDRCRRMLDAGAPTCARCHDGVSAMPVEALPGHPGCAR